MHPVRSMNLRRKPRQVASIIKVLPNLQAGSIGSGPLQHRPRVSQANPAPQLETGDWRPATLFGCLSAPQSVTSGFAHSLE